MEIATEELSKNELLSYIENLESILSSFGVKTCNVYWGWQCELPIDDLWKPQNIPVNSIEKMVKKGIEDGIFNVGESDFYIKSDEYDFKIQICHHSDIHVTTSSLDIAKIILSPIINSGKGIQHQVGKEWEPINLL